MLSFNEPNEVFPDSSKLNKNDETSTLHANQSQTNNLNSTTTLTIVHLGRSVNKTNMDVNDIIESNNSITINNSVSDHAFTVFHLVASSQIEMKNWKEAILKQQKIILQESMVIKLNPYPMGNEDNKSMYYTPIYSSINCSVYFGIKIRYF